MPMNMGYPMNYGNMPYGNGMQNSGMPMDQQGYMMMNQGMGSGVTLAAADSQPDIDRKATAAGGRYTYMKIK